ncbi:MAG: hypothetical protein ACM3XO_08405 [Bacteroidota bacterium]
MRSLLILCVVLALIGSSMFPHHIHAQAARLPSGEKEPVEAAFSSSGMSVSLRAATDATILFKSTNGEQTRAPQEQERKIPYLVLDRNGVATPGFERTLRLSLENLRVPAPGLYAELQVQTQHSNPDEPGAANKEKLLVWEEARYIPGTPDSQGPGSLDFNIVFQNAFEDRGTSVRTPTDYYSYRLTLSDPQGNVLQSFEQDYAFLLESQWRVPLPKVRESAPGAAPNVLLVYFCDMVPFQADARDLESRIPRQDVERYVQTELIPAMVSAFLVQSNLWNMPWYPEWSNFRSVEESKTLSVALGGAGTWFHGAAPSLGHAMISIRVDGTYGEYPNLTDGILSVFHHELFHNQQRNISLHEAGNDNISGRDQAWEFFSEGTAVLASLVGQPGVQMQFSGMPRSYLKRANAFIGSDGMIGGGLNKSYTEVPYHTALYWRFLYERCGGIKAGIEDPAAGMQIIRHVLETLYSGTVVNINSSTASIQSLPRIMDMALQATPTCAFKSFNESLVGFTRSIYMLRRADGRCLGSLTATCGFFDPHHLYSVPNAESDILAAGAVLDGAIPSSFGLDLVALSLDPSVQGKTVQLNFDSIQSPGDEFHVELWAHRRLSQAADNVNGKDLMYSGRSRNGRLVIALGRINVQEYSSLDVVITRMDTHEAASDPGRYTIGVTVE